MKYIPTQIIQQVFVLLLIFFIGSLIFIELVPYLSGVLGAITIYVLMRGLMMRLVRKGVRQGVAAIVIILLSIIGIVIPVTGIIMLLSNKIGNAVANSERFLAALKIQMTEWEDRLNIDLASQIDVGKITSWISESMQRLAGGTFNALIAVGIMYFILYYLLTNRGRVKHSLASFLPLSRTNVGIISIEFQRMVRSNALGIPLVAIAQGIVALIGFLIFGVDDPFFWFVIVTIGSMIPFVGTLVGIIPVFILELSSGNTFGAWGIALYGLIVVGSTDNIIRLYVLKRLDDVHPLITLIGVLVGVPLFGFIGLIFGPLMIDLFLVIVGIYRKEYMETKNGDQPELFPREETRSGSEN
jgi:predicted PurR-regulated permease PerM